MLQFCLFLKMPLLLVKCGLKSQTHYFGLLWSKIKEILTSKHLGLNN